MSLFAFKCDNGKKIGACPQLVRAGMSNIKPLEAPIGARKQIRVLHVDDKEMIRNMVTRLLRGVDASVTSATGYESALSILEKDKCFDAVVLDIELEGEPSGVQLFRKLPEELKGKVFFFSGGCSKNDFSEIHEIGRPLIDKVMGGSELVAKIKELASQSS